TNPATRGSMSSTPTTGSTSSTSTMGSMSSTPAMVSTSSTSTTTTTTTTIDNSMTQPELIRQTQFELRRHGYSIPSNAGAMDMDPSDGILAYQAENGMAQTGMPSAQLLYALRTDNRMVSQTIPPGQIITPVQPSAPTTYGPTITPTQPSTPMSYGSPVP